MMRSTVLAILLALFTSEAAIAQPPTAANQAALRTARIKIWTGIALMSAGALVLPLTTAAQSRKGEPGDGALMGSLGLIGVGGGVVVWGFTQQRQVLQPSTAFGVTLGRKTGVVVRRSW
jgi:hypothetical protein